jgi:hypothetical protein
MERAPEPYIGLSPVDAKMIGVDAGVAVTIRIDKNEYTYPVKIVESLRNGVALVPKGLPGMPGMNWGEWVEIVSRQS